MQEPILIVDDDEAFGLVVQRALTRRGFSVVLCHFSSGTNRLCAAGVLKRLWI